MGRMPDGTARTTVEDGTDAGPGAAANRRGRGRPRGRREKMDARQDRDLGGHRPAGRRGLVHARDHPGRNGQRNLVRVRLGLYVPDRLPLLLEGDRTLHHQAQRPPRHSRRVQGRRQGLRPHGPQRPVRPSLCRHRRRRAAGGPRHRRPDGLPARHHLDHHRRRPRRSRPGLPGDVLLHAPRRTLAGPDGPRGTRRHRRHRRPDRHAAHHGDHRRHPRARRRQRPGRKPLGRLLRGHDHPDRPLHGRLPALPPARQGHGSFPDRLRAADGRHHRRRRSSPEPSGAPRSSTWTRSPSPGASSSTASSPPSCRSGCSWHRATTSPRS